MFMLAQLYDEDNYMNDEMKAKELYEKIISEFPKSDWAENAKAGLKYIGKSDVQITNLITGKK